MEKKVRMEYTQKKEGRQKKSENQENKDEKKIREKREKAIFNLNLEYTNRKNQLIENKKSLLQKLKEEPENKMDISKELMTIDYQMKENEKFYYEEETKIDQTISNRLNVHMESQFKFEDWMDEIIETSLLEEFFNFQKALSLIKFGLKNKDVPHTDLLNELALRVKWSEIENKRRKQLEKEEVSTLVECDYEDDSIKLLMNKVGHFNDNIKGLESTLIIKGVKKTENDDLKGGEIQQVSDNKNHKSNKNAPTAVNSDKNFQLSHLD